MCISSSRHHLSWPHLGISFTGTTGSQPSPFCLAFPSLSSDLNPCIASPLYNIQALHKECRMITIPACLLALVFLAKWYCSWWPRGTTSAEDVALFQLVVWLSTDSEEAPLLPVVWHYSRWWYDAINVGIASCALWWRGIVRVSWWCGTTPPGTRADLSEWVPVLPPQFTRPTTTRHCIVTSFISNFLISG